MRLIIALALLLSFPALADITGPVRVINADTLDLGGKRIRLHGIDALEAKQVCWDKTARWKCGEQATAALKGLIGTAEIRCAERGVDRIKQIIAVCYLGKINLSAWLVSQGWAIAFRRVSDTYSKQEDAANAAGLGMWQSQFVMPWLWRRNHR
jgi:endonuclease YncB( thermonuclease family)